MRNFLQNKEYQIIAMILALTMVSLFYIPTYLLEPYTPEITPAVEASSATTGAITTTNAVVVPKPEAVTIINNSSSSSSGGGGSPPKTITINAKRLYGKSNTDGNKTYNRRIDKNLTDEFVPLPLWKYNETVFKNSPSSNGNDGVGSSFSACLLIADDNHRLPEWLAYHYWALPLRYLVVAVDPNSHALPYEIFQRWSQNSNMTIVLWNPIDRRLKTKTGPRYKRKFLNKGLQKEMVTQYKELQYGFYHQCTMHLMKHNRSTWTAYSDIDEYLTINSDAVEGSQRLFSQPGSIMQVVEALTKSNKNQALAQRIEDGMEEFVKNSKPWWYNKFPEFECVPLPRILFSAYESTTAEVWQGVPYSWINASNFETLRWRYRAWSKEVELNKKKRHPKSIVDLTRISLESYKNSSGHCNAHKPMFTFCPKDNMKKPYGELLPLGFHHYLGGWESYSCRDDTRSKVNQRSSFFSHNKNKWNRSAFQKDGGPDDQVRPWIKGFVESVGEQTAQVLLEGVGDYSHCTF